MSYQCTKSLTHNSNLRRHRRTPTGEKDFPCNQCAKSYTQNSNLKSHRIYKRLEFTWTFNSHRFHNITPQATHDNPFHITFGTFLKKKRKIWDFLGKKAKFGTFSRKSPVFYYFCSRKSPVFYYFCRSRIFKSPWVRGMLSTAPVPVWWHLYQCGPNPLGGARY